MFGIRLWISLTRLIASTSPVGGRVNFVGTVAGADGDRQRVELRGLDELGGFFRVGQQLVVPKLADGADAVLPPASPVSSEPRQPSSPSNGDADLVRHRDDLLRYIDVVVEIGRRFAVFLQRAIHHDRAEAKVDRALTNLRAGAVVLVHHQRDVRVSLGRRLNQVFDEALASVFAGAGTRLQDHRGADLSAAPP